ncbi:MAG TPA: RIO1 family regulatory kinase/ATPase, partial [Nitrososphaerales archaeon]|nr:RIO1 family regulatory kinase/ATPase [Nitrososphaerales archaeon]
LKDYVRKDLISALGAIIAKGKESDVYEVLTEEGSVYALKFYKIGRTSFTRVRKSRRIEESEIKSWMAANYEAAKREYAALRRLAGLSPAFPAPVGYSRSTVLLQQVSGVRLSQRPELQDPLESFTKVVDAMRLAYTKAGIVNGDLSEYNILTDGVDVWLIDWPQSVRTTDQSAPALIDHDVGAVVTFYRRAYGVAGDMENTLAYIKGEGKLTMPVSKSGS